MNFNLFEQIDYVYFCYGFAFFLLAWICLLLHNRKNPVIPWKWLGLAALINSAGIWSNLVTFSLGVNPILDTFRLYSAIPVLLVLFEFGRRLVVVSMRTKDILIRRIFASGGLLLAIYVLTAAVGFIWHDSSLLLIEIILSYFLAAIFWIYQYFTENIVAAHGGARNFRLFIRAASVFLVVIFFGFMITNIIGNYYRYRSRNSLLTRAETIATILNAERIKTLSGSGSDLSSENYNHLKRQLIMADSVNSDCRFIYLMGKKDGRIFFFMDSLNISELDYSPPGQIFEEASPDLAQVFSAGASFVKGPLIDRWGEWISAFTPVKDPTTGKVIAVLGMDIDAKSWMRGIFDHRIVGILISLVLLIGLIAVLRLNETSFAEISAQRTRFDVVANAMEDGVVVCGSDCTAINMNSAAVKYLGIENAQGVNIFEHILNNFTLTLTKEALLDTSLPHRNFDIIRKETEHFRPLCLEAQLDLVKSQSGEVSGVVLVLRDVTEARKEEELKHGFLELMSHKLRTPMMIIMENANMLKDESVLGALNVTQKNAVTAILKKSELLNNLINKLLSFVEISKACADAVRERIELCAYLSDTVKPLAEKVSDKKVELGIDCGKEIILNCDKKIFGIVVKNLVENAIKFNDKGLIKIDIRVKKTPQDVSISFTDNGPGIPSEDRDRVFQKFYQVEKYLTGQVEGVGLGLPLTRHLVEIAGGQIGLKSEIGKGATFIVTMPCPKS